MLLSLRVVPFKRGGTANFEDVALMVYITGEE